MWSELQNFNQHLNDELGEALFEYFFVTLPHHRFNSLLHLWPTNIDDGAFLEARLFEKLCSAQLVSPLGSSGFQSTQASCVFHLLRLEEGWCDTARGGNHWQAQWMEPPVWVLAWEGAQKQKHEGCTQAKRLQHPTIRPLYTVRQSLSTWRNFRWHAMMHSTPMKWA